MQSKIKAHMHEFTCDARPGWEGGAFCTICGFRVPASTAVALEAWRKLIAERKNAETK
jgi:hypothetical protein